MKKFCLILLMLFVVVSLSSALQFGVKGGVVLSKFSKNLDGYSPETDFGFTGGICAHMPLPAMENLVIIGEANYVQKGTMYDTTEGEYFLNTNYFELAALGKFMVSDMIGIYAGPSYAFLTEGTAEMNDHEVDIKDSLSNGEFSLNIGGQVSVGPVIFDGRFNLGLTNNFDEDPEDTYEIKTRTFSLSACYLF